MRGRWFCSSTKDGLLQRRLRFSITLCLNENLRTGLQNIYSWLLHKAHLLVYVCLFYWKRLQANISSLTECCYKHVPKWWYKKNASLIMNKDMGQNHGRIDKWSNGLTEGRSNGSTDEWSHNRSDGRSNGLSNQYASLFFESMYNNQEASFVIKSQQNKIWKKIGTVYIWWGFTRLTTKNLRHEWKLPQYFD